VEVGQLNRLWRFCGTAFSFFAFGSGGLCLTIFWFPLVNFFVRDNSRKKAIAQVTIRQTFRLFINMMRWLGALDVVVEGREELRKDKGCIIIANHPSLIDYVLITSLLPQCVCIVKQSMWTNLFARGSVTAAGYIPNTDTSDMLSKCDKTLKSGNVLLVFPEGTRTVPGQPLNLKRGAAHIAVRTQRDIRLLHIQCNPSVLGKHDKWYKVPNEKPIFLVQVKEKVNIQTYVEAWPSDAIAARHLTSYLSQKLVPKTD
jgi:1-acyl-sn-glycerol-3-phosphate acyltransferase